MSENDDEFDLHSLCAPISGDAPVGCDLEGTLALDALETAVREPDEPSIAGVARVDARDWRAVEADARALLARSKDLRVAVILCRALSERHGLSGFAAGTALLAELVARYWSEIYPRADEDGDPAIRINSLRELVSPAQLAVLRAAEVASVPALGRFGVNDVLVASDSPAGRVAAEPPAREHVLGALAGLGAARVGRLRIDVRSVRDALSDVAARVERETGQPLGVAELVTARGERKPGLLDALEAVLAAHAARLAPPPDLARAEDEGSVDAHDAVAAPRAHAVPDGTIRRREDVLRVLDDLVDYYARAEPSSPVPLLLKRARRLATMDFMQIIEDLAQAGMPQVASVAGVPSE